MSHHDHTEEHGQFSYVIRDAVIGLADGLTVPFALAAGLSGVVNSTSLIVTAGVAEIAAGAIAMGLGGYMAARTEAEQYHSERLRETLEVERVPHIEEKEVTDILEEYGVPHEEALLVTAALKKNPERWVDFMMRFELGLEKPNPSELLHTPLTIGFSYIIGGLIPLLPYMIYDHASKALPVSVVVTLLALAIFGTIKGHFIGISKLKSAFQTTLIGGLAAAVAFGLARLLG
ncbi:MAG: VIT1/CCC1 transporter family protein [Alphaproteobacteria bacterium]